jgi:dihydroorotate dehydrogenase (NAD+) catalytic subunit
MTIDLAPHHKQGLPVANPILAAGGSVGYGEARHAGLDMARLGAVVVGPIMRRSLAGKQPPRLAHVDGGLVLETGLQNRGVSAVIRKFARLWPGLGCPVIAQIADAHPDLAAETAERLAGVDAVSGLELLIPRHADGGLVRRLVQAVDRAADLPVWVKPPLSLAVELAPPAVEAGAAALVIAQPLTGAGLARTPDDPPVQGAPAALVRGPVYGPLAFAPMLDVLAQVAALDLPAARIACGGIHTPEQVRQALAVGASAVQLDSALWVEPGLAGRLVDELKERTK